MTMNLFSSFDPSTNLFNLNWFSTLFMLFMMKNYWMKINIINSLIHLIIKILFNEMKLITNKKMMIMTLSIFLIIFNNNFMSLNPYFFCSTSHLSVNLSFIMPIWMSLMMYSWSKKLKISMIHLVPNSTPLLLTPFMIMIELMMNIMRPFTLSVRLMANMMSGHLMLNLMSNIKYLSYQMEFIYLMMEIMISFLQAYIFILLINLFISEIN